MFFFLFPCLQTPQHFSFFFLPLVEFSLHRHFSTSSCSIFLYRDILFLLWTYLSPQLFLCFTLCLQSVLRLLYEIFYEKAWISSLCAFHPPPFWLSTVLPLLLFCVSLHAFSRSLRFLPVSVSLHAFSRSLRYLPVSVSLQAFSRSLRIPSCLLCSVFFLSISLSL